MIAKHRKILSNSQYLVLGILLGISSGISIGSAIFGLLFLSLLIISAINLKENKE